MKQKAKRAAQVAALIFILPVLATEPASLAGVIVWAIVAAAALAGCVAYCKRKGYFADL